MRRALSLASLLLVARGDFPMPYTLDEAFLNSLASKNDERVSPYIVGGEVSRTHTWGGTGPLHAHVRSSHHILLLSPPRFGGLRARGSSITRA